VLVELGLSVDPAFTAELSEERSAEMRFVLLQLGERLFWKGLRLDSALQHCLVIAVEHARVPTYLDHEVASFACGLSAHILSERSNRITEAEVANMFATPNDPVTQRIIREITRIVHVRWDQKEAQINKKPTSRSDR